VLSDPLASQTGPSGRMPRVWSGDTEAIAWPEDFPFPALPRVARAEDADLLLFPWYWQPFRTAINPSQLDPDRPDLAAALQQRLDQLEAASQRLAKPLLLFRYHDSSEPLPHAHGWVWRTSLLASQRGSHEQALPAFHADPQPEWQALGGCVDPLAWTAVPSVGFCGQALPLDPGLRKRLGEALRRRLGRPLAGIPGYRWRRDAMRSCRRHPAGLTCGFQLSDPLETTAAAEQRRRFLANLYGHHYVICASGYGNYSYRFYEALAAGRIPVFIDSDCVLPFEELVPWRELVVWVEASEVHRTADRILAFHQQFDAAALHDHQRKLRELWQSHCTPAGFQRTVSVQLTQQAPH
jgi:hypothetical protein